MSDLAAFILGLCLMAGLSSIDFDINIYVDGVKKEAVHNE